MKEVKLSDKNSQRVQQLFVEKNRVEQLLQHTILTIVDSSNVKYLPDDLIRISDDYKKIIIETNKK